MYCMSVSQSVSHCKFLVIYSVIFWVRTLWVLISWRNALPECMIRDFHNVVDENEGPASCSTLSAGNYLLVTIYQVTIWHVVTSHMSWIFVLPASLGLESLHLCSKCVWQVKLRRPHYHCWSDSMAPVHCLTPVCCCLIWPYCDTIDLISSNSNPPSPQYYLTIPLAVA